MIANKYSSLVIFILLLFISSCSKDETTDNYIPSLVSPVNFNLESVPYNTLSEYNFFSGDLANLTPVLGVIPFQPITELFADYAKKKRFLWMPNSAAASYVSDAEVLSFPVGTIMIKNFYYDNVLPENKTKIIETRLLINTASGWTFAHYIWNEAQTEAFLDTSGSTIQIEWQEGPQTKSTNYRIPSASECLTCHKKSNIATPIGVKPQNLNSDYNYGSSEIINQLQKLTNVGYLQAFDYSNTNTIVNWKDTSQPLELRARSYLDINCAHCHSDNGHCSYRAVRFPFQATENSEENLGICVEPAENIDATLTHIISPGRPERSVLSFRLNSMEESNKMPLLGRNIVDEEAVALINQWIDQLDQMCL